MQRNQSIDFTRALAIVVIVTCHFLIFGGIDGLEPVGRYLAGVGNFVFFAISALLFGLRYEQKGPSAFETKLFMKKRLVRLFASLWPFLIVILSIYSYIGVELNPIKLAMNFAGFCWFAKLPNIGHLWFVTQIIFCYFLYVIATKYRITNKLNMGGYLWLKLLIISVLSEVSVDAMSLPGYMFVILFYSLWFFVNASKFLNWVNNISWWWLTLVFILTNVLSIFVCYQEDVIGTTIRNLSGCLAGLSCLMVLLKAGNAVECNKILMFLAGTGYEIYLVHHALCCGELSVIHFTDYGIFNYSLLWICAGILGWLLKLLGDRINQLIMK